MAKFLLLLASRIAGILKTYFARVSADGGTTVDKNHTKEVYADTIGDEPTLIQSCDSGKATVLYSIIPPQDFLLYQYGGAAAAYSLRSLSSSTTNVVKVRRSGDDAELDFTASEVSDGTLAAWVVAGGGTEDGFVTTWYDQSGNTRNATQATAANQPKIVSSGSVLTENGNATINFNGDELVVPTSQATFKFLHDGTTISTAFATARFGNTADPNDVAVVFSTSNTNKPGIFFAYEDRASGSFNNAFRVSVAAFNAYTAEIIVNDKISPQTQTALYALIDPSNATADDRIRGAVNGGSDFGGNTLTTTPSTLDSNKNFTIGFNLINFYMNIQEIIIYASDQSANRTGIEANINDYYNIYP